MLSPRFMSGMFFVLWLPILHGQMTPKNEPAAMGSDYQPLLWRDADAQFALDAERAGVCQVAADQLVGSRSADTELQELAAHSIGLHDRMNRQLKSMAKTVGFKLGSKKHPPECPDRARLAGLTGEQFDRSYLSVLANTNDSERANFTAEVKAPLNSANYGLKKFAAHNLALFSEQQKKIRELEKRYEPAKP